MLPMYCEKDQRGRDDLLVMVMIAYWSLLHASTNHTMNEMTMGWGTVMSLQVHIGQPDKDEG